MNRALLVWLSALVVGAAALLLPGPAGQIAAHLALGVIPGLGLMFLLLPSAGRMTRLTLGVAFGPLVGATCGWLLSSAGMPWPLVARLVVAIGLALLAIGLVVPRPAADDAEQGPGLDRFGWLLLIGATALVAIPPLTNEFNRIRSDSWIHAGIAADILEHGLPPVDPRFAGLRLNYVWFYNLYLALVTSSNGQRDLFGTMALMNVVDMATLMAITWLLAVRVWRSAHAARGSLLLLSLGLNAGAWLLWPMHGLRALTGEHQGRAEWARILGELHLDSTFVFHTLAAPFAAMVNHWDKWTVGSSIGYAYLFIGVLLLALTRANGQGAWRWRIIAAMAAASMLLFHSVVGLSVVPVAIAALALRWLLSARPRSGADTRAQSVTLLALMAGAATTLPYLRSITSGWDAERSGVAHQFLHMHWLMPWTLLTACGVAVCFALPGLRRAWREQDPALRLVGIWAVGMVAFAIVVHLPEGNEVKFVWQVFFALAILGGPSFWAWAHQPRSGIRRARFAVLAASVFIVPTALAFWGLVRDRAEAYQPDLIAVMHPPAGAAAFHRWVRDSTPPDAVLLDDDSRDHLMVLGRRRLLVGTRFDPQRAAFPAVEMALRRAIQSDLFGEMRDPTGSIDALRAAVVRMRSVHAVGPAFVVYRGVSREASPTRWSRLLAAVPGLTVVYSADDLVIVRVPTE